MLETSLGRELQWETEDRLKKVTYILYVHVLSYRMKVALKHNINVVFFCMCMLYHTTWRSPGSITSLLYVCKKAWTDALDWVHADRIASGHMVCKVKHWMQFSSSTNAVVYVYVWWWCIKMGQVHQSGFNLLFGNWNTFSLWQLGMCLFASMYLYWSGGMLVLTCDVMSLSFIAIAIMQSIEGHSCCQCPLCPCAVLVSTAHLQPMRRKLESFQTHEWHAVR